MSLETRVDRIVFALAAVTYVVLGIWIGSVVLNWIVGPLYLVLVTWVATPVVTRSLERARAAR